MRTLFLLCPLLLSTALPSLAAPTVVIDGFQFIPETLTVKRGTTVTFVNKDGTPHTVSPEGKAKFIGIDRLLTGESKTITFKERGMPSYFCQFHTTMRGKIIVK
jgi:plastocyanin